MSAEFASKKNLPPSLVCRCPDDVKEVTVLPDYQLRVVFIDGTAGVVFMRALIFSSNAGVFAALKEVELFNQAYVEYGTVVWPGEVDLAPDVMYSAFKAGGQWVLKG